MSEMLYGRDRDLASVLALLDDRDSPARVITLTGPPGVGKSGLARAVYRAASEGNCPSREQLYLDLAHLDSMTCPSDEMARMLEIEGSGGCARIGALIARLQSSSTLLVLDNADSAVESVGALVQQLIQGCDGLRVLVTCRELLSIVGAERVYRLQPLAVPPLVEDAATTDTVRDFLTFPSIRLFLEQVRLRGYEPGAVQPPSADLLTIARICRRLDGIPLLIGLAAARFGPLTIAELERELDNRFDLLRRPRPGIPRHHSTARSLIDWSYDRLLDAEARLLRRLAVFPNDWTRNAAREVCADDLVPPADVLSLLANLVDKSLVMSVAVGDRTRYTLLETVREYVRPRLLADPDAGEVWLRRDEVLLSIVAQNRDRLRGPDQVEALQALEEERENVLEALREALPEAAGSPTGARLAPDGGTGGAGGNDRSQADVRRRVAVKLLAAFHPFWMARGENDVALHWLGLVADTAAEPTPDLAEIWSGISLAHGSVGRFDLARQAAEQALDVATRCGDAGAIATAHLRLGQALVDRSEAEAGRHHLDRALIGFGNGRMAWGLVAARRYLALSHLVGGHDDPTADDLRAAGSLLDRAVEEARALGDPHELGVTLRYRAQVALAEGESPLAHELLVEAIRTLRTIDDRSCIARAIGELGAAALGLRQVARAVFLTAAAKRLGGEQSGRQIYDRSTLMSRARTLLSEERFAGEARRARRMRMSELLDQALDARWASGKPDGPADAVSAWPLTVLEWNYVRLVVAGKSNAEIADLMVVSLRTVENKLSLIYRRTGIADHGGNRRARLIAGARAQGLLTDVEPADK